jgi:hypothetical protein
MVESRPANSENLNGLSKKKAESENCQAQASQTHEAASAQEAPAVQVVTLVFTLLRRGGVPFFACSNVEAGLRSTMPKVTI